MPFPTVVTIYDGDSDLNYLPPQWESGIRDSAWSFYRGGVRWVCLAKRLDDPDLPVGYKRAPAMFYSLDNGETWAGPADDANAPTYFYDPDDPTYNHADALIWNYDIRIGDDGGLNPEDITLLTVLIQTGSVVDGPDAGKYTFAYCDFDLDAKTWGAHYGDFTRFANVVYPRGYSSQPGGGAIFWSTGTELGVDETSQQIEGTTDIRGAGGYGTINAVVASDGVMYTVADTHDPGTPGLETMPDAGFGNTSNLRVVGSDVVIAAAEDGMNLSLWAELAEPSYTGIWTSTQIDISPQTFGSNPWVIFCEGALHVYWAGAGGSGVWRVVNQGGTSWSLPLLVSDVENITLGPNVCNNPVLGGVDVTLMLGAYQMVTFHLPSIGGGEIIEFAARYYGM